MTDTEITAILDSHRADEFSDEPRWVTLTRSIKQRAELIGTESETAWLLRLAAEEIVKANQRVEYLERTVCDQDKAYHDLAIKHGEIKPID